MCVEQRFQCSGVLETYGSRIRQMLDNCCFHSLSSSYLYVLVESSKDRNPSRPLSVHTYIRQESQHDQGTYRWTLRFRSRSDLG